MENIAQDAQFVAENDANVDVDTIAEIYAVAYTNAVKANNNSIDSAVEEFGEFIDILKSNEKFATILSSAMITADEKIALIEKTISNAASTNFMNFLRVAARRNRLDILKQIYKQTQIILNKQNKRIPVTITSATEIDPELLNTLSIKLAKIIGGEPIVKSVVDPATIGGLIVRVGDTVYDASLMTQLKSIRKQIIERSAHEIQTRRDNFKNE
ncbi:MAG: ATP synthase F1 subunit delta [Planctomycetaceae bacterium]|jgi:ATP synthase F1 delta subunit|nr:ATP synthase F1 subunit delta [Planctomycetaceae bacterium]